jgi:hypothetical protein
LAGSASFDGRGAFLTHVASSSGALRQGQLYCGLVKRRHVRPFKCAPKVLLRPFGETPTIMISPRLAKAARERKELSLNLVQPQRAPQVRTLDFLRAQLPSLAPMIVVSLAGVVLSLRDLKRLGKPAALALIGCGMVFLAALVIPIVQGCILYLREDQKWAFAEVSMWVGVLAIVRTLFQAIGFAVLLAAFFEGRTAPASKPDTQKSRRNEIWD